MVNKKINAFQRGWGIIRTSIVRAQLFRSATLSLKARPLIDEVMLNKCLSKFQSFHSSDYQSWHNMLYKEDDAILIIE